MKHINKLITAFIFPATVSCIFVGCSGTEKTAEPSTPAPFYSEPAPEPNSVEAIQKLIADGTITEEEGMQRMYDALGLN